MNIDEKVFFAVCAALAVLTVLYDLYSESRAEEEEQLLPQMIVTGKPPGSISTTSCE